MPGYNPSAFSLSCIIWSHYCTRWHNLGFYFFLNLPVWICLVGFFPSTIVLGKMFFWQSNGIILLLAGYSSTGRTKLNFQVAPCAWAWPVLVLLPVYYGDCCVTNLHCRPPDIKLKAIISEGPWEAQTFPITDLRCVPAEHQGEGVRSFCFQPGGTSAVQAGAVWECETPCAISSKLCLHLVVWLGAHMALPQSLCKTKCCAKKISCQAVSKEAGGIYWLVSISIEGHHLCLCCVVQTSTHPAPETLV